MKIEKKDKDLSKILILGVSAGGTTIVNSLFNSPHNSFSMCEPCWLLNNKTDNVQEVVEIYMDKLGAVRTSLEMLPQEVESRLGFDEYEIGGVKETFAAEESDFGQYVLRNFDFDMAVFCWREPGLVLDSAISNSSSKSVQELFEKKVRDYSYLRGIRDSLGIPCIELFLQDLRSFPKQYLNTQFEGFLRFTGSMELKREKFAYGNDKAKASQKILPSDRETENIDERLRSKINDAVKWDLLKD